MTRHHLLGLSGSLRKDSTNRKLIHEAARLYDGTTFTEGDLRLPLYDGDLEAEVGIPAEVQTLVDQIAAADAVVISGPEYNKSLSGVLKNAFDWVSRVKANPWIDKPVAVMSAAAGRSGGETAQFTLRHALVPFRPRLLHGPQVMIASASKEFGDNGQLLNERYIKILTDLMAALRTEVERG